VVGVADLVAIQLYEGRIQIVTNNLVLLLLNDQLIWKAKISIKIKGNVSIHLLLLLLGSKLPKFDASFG
jgi:hypothetical protein